MPFPSSSLKGSFLRSTRTDVDVLITTNAAQKGWSYSGEKTNPLRSFDRV